MKTKFFKKLSLVLVVAMVLSLFVPAAGVFAAAKPALNSKSKYLHLSGNPGPNEFNFNIKNKKSGWKYFWESSKEEFAEVNQKNGVVTAKAVGKTTITVTITDKDGEEVDTLKATVTVRDNIKEVTIKNPVEKLAVGVDHDYDRSFVTESGSTKKTDSITRWTVEPAEGAEIKDNGLFVAKEAGEYTITARSFQSKARHKAWSEDPEKYADYVLDSDTTKVVVSANIVGITQKDKNVIAVEFDSSMKDADLSDKTIVISRLINGKLYNTGIEKVKSVSLDATEKIATVETYGNFTGKAEYQFAFGDLKDNFTAADTDIKEVAGLIFDDFQVVVKDGVITPEDLYTKVKAINSDGVVILHGVDSALKPYLTFEYKGNPDFGWAYNNTGNDKWEAYINKSGQSGEFVVKYSNFIFADATKTYEHVEFTASATGVGVDQAVNNTTMLYALKRDFSGSNAAPGKNDANTWFATGFAVPAGDEAYGIYTKYKNNTDPSWVDYTLAPVNKFNYVSTDTDKMVIHGNYMYPIKQGVVTVLVQDPANNAVLGAFDVTINPTRTYLSAIPSNNNVSLGNAVVGTGHNESRTVTLTSTDSMNDPVEIDSTKTLIELVTYPKDATGTETLVTAGSVPTRGAWDYGKAYFNVSAVGAEPGLYNYKVTVGALGATKIFNVFVTVLDGDDKVVVPGAWKVEMSESNIDLKNQTSAKSIQANVYGYNKYNARVKVLDSTTYAINVVKSGTTTPIASSGKIVNNDIPVAYTSGSAVIYVDLTTYQVTAKVSVSGSETGRNNGTIIGNPVTFKVEDTMHRDLVRNKTSVSTSGADQMTVRAAVKDAFTVKFDYGDVNFDVEGANINIKYTLGGRVATDDGTATNVKVGESIFVSQIFYTKNNVTYTYNVNQTISIAR